MLGRAFRIGAGICVHNEEDYIVHCLRGIYDLVDAIAVSVNTGVPWGGRPEPIDRTLELVEGFPDPAGKIRLQPGEWPGEIDQRNSNLDLIRHEIDYYMVLDADEFYSASDFDRIRRFVRWRPYVGQFRIRVNTYWKTNPVHRIDPPEPLKQYILSRVSPATRFIGLRTTNEKWRCVIPRKVAALHHFSYTRPSEKVLQKIRNFSHKDQIVPGWYENVWLGWDSNPSLENLHPTNPPEYRRAVPVEIDTLPEAMRDHPFVQAIEPR